MKNVPSDTGPRPSTEQCFVLERSQNKVIYNRQALQYVSYTTVLLNSKFMTITYVTGAPYITHSRTHIGVGEERNQRDVPGDESLKRRRDGRRRKL